MFNTVLVVLSSFQQLCVRFNAEEIAVLAVALGEAASHVL